MINTINNYLYFYVVMFVSLSLALEPTSLVRAATGWHQNSVLRLLNWLKLLSTGFKISLYPVSKAISFLTSYPLDGDSSTRRKRYLTFEHLGPEVYDNDS